MPAAFLVNAPAHGHVSLALLLVGREFVPAVTPENSGRRRNSVRAWQSFLSHICAILPAWRYTAPQRVRLAEVEDGKPCKTTSSRASPP
jgi:hypothetical protein